MASQQPPGESKTINISTTKNTNGYTAASWRIPNHKHFNKKIRKWLHSNLLENPKPSTFQQKNMQMVSQQPPGESKTINISTNKCANGFTTASWRIKNNQYFSKQNEQMVHSNLLENPKQSIFKQKKCANGFTAASWRIQNHKYLNKKNVQLASQQPPGESKTINIS